MSLNWDLSAIKDSDTVCWITATEDNPGQGRRVGEKYMSPITNTLIWATMAVGVGHLETEADAAEFYLRLSAIEELSGAFLQVAGEVDGAGVGRSEDRPITWEEVKAHVGLRTNVFPRWSRQKFGDHLFSLHANEKRRKIDLPEPKVEERREPEEGEGGRWVLELTIDADCEDTAEAIKDDIGSYLPDIENEVDGDFNVSTGRLRRVD